MNNVFDFDYNNSILSVSNSILKHYGVPTYHKTLNFLDNKLKTNKKNVILLILDGMGIDLINKNMKPASFIRKNIAQSIYSVFPSTTAAATISWHSAMSPWESGWIGWSCYYPQYNQIVENFRNTNYYNGKKLSTPFPIEDIIKYETIYEKITKHNPSVEYHKIFPISVEPDGVTSFEEMCERIIYATKNSNKQKIISAYWNEPDHSTHILGTNNKTIKNILSDIDKTLEKMYSELEDSIIIVSADHGQIDIEEIYLNNFPEICKTFRIPPSIEARFLTFFIKENMQNIFENEFNKHFSADFKLYTKQEFMQSGLLGSGKMHKQIPYFIGDYVVIATSNKNLRYTTGEKNFQPLKGDHSGISEQEMLIPLIVLEK